jgi:hypothetical protein
MMDFGKKMKNAKKTKSNGRYTIRQLVAIATLAVLTCTANVACTWQHSELDEGGGVLPVPKQDEVQLEQVTLKLVIHDGLNQTKAVLEDADETAITRVDAFVFDEQSGVFLYKAVTSPPYPEGNVPGSPQVVDVELQILPGTARTRPVSIQFLANSWGQQNVGGIEANWDNDNGWILDETDKNLTYITELLGFPFRAAYADNVTQYNYQPDPTTGVYTNTNPTPVAIPMWGQLQNVVVKTLAEGGVTYNGAAEPESVRLLRMVARIDVNLDPSVGLTLGDIVYYNYPKNGRLIPDIGNPGVFTDPSHLYIAQAPSFMTGHAHNTAVDSIVYKASTIALAKPDTNTIYSFEESNVISQIRIFQNCLVVQLLNDDQTYSYYRIDFLQKSATTNLDEQIAIIRNHHYFVNIRRVDPTKGYPTPREALEGLSLVAEVTVGFDDTNVIEWEPEDNIGGDDITAQNP